MELKAFFEILIEKHWATISVERTGSQALVGWLGQSVTADFVEVTPGGYSLLVNGRSYDVMATVVDGKYLISVNGALFEVPLRDPKKFRSRGSQNNDIADPTSVVAPMPGKVVKLLVREGETVSEGQGVAVIEAMKMQNELKAPKSGTVEKIRVTENQAVNAGESLLVVK